MVVRVRSTSFCCITQHHHASLAGALAAHWPLASFPEPARRAEVLLAIREHDRGWISLDATPLWNDRQQAPYSFLDYPALPKLPRYQQGIAEVVRLAPYAGLLYSLHYGSFGHLAHSAAGTAFLRREARRQQQLRRQLRLASPVQQAALAFHVRLLKFCDSLSLSLCLHEPAATKAAATHQAGTLLPDSENLTTDGQPIRASWLAGGRVRLTPFPFEAPFPIALPYKELSKATIQVQGLAATYERTPLREQAGWVIQLVD